MCSLLRHLGGLHGLERLLEQVQKVYRRGGLLVNEQQNLLVLESRMIELLSRKFPALQFYGVDLPGLCPHQFQQLLVQLDIHVVQAKSLCDWFATWLEDFLA